MPSFRVTMTIGALRPGVPPDRVLPTAADAAAQLATVEASSVNVVRGEARLTVRFTAEDAELAEQIARHVVDTTAGVVEVIVCTVTRRSGDRWYTVSRA
jgi:hypothetical protein